MEIWIKYSKQELDNKSSHSTIPCCQIVLNHLSLLSFQKSSQDLFIYSEGDVQKKCLLRNYLTSLFSMHRQSLFIVAEV